MFGIENFHPLFLTSAEDFIAHTRAKLMEILGEPIVTSWVLWNKACDTWWSEFPIILGIKGRRLELCIYNDNQLSASWETIDIAKPLFRDSNGAGDHLYWREDALPVLVNAKGQRLKKIKVIEYQRQLTVLRDIEKPSFVGKTFDSEWLLVGIELKLERSYLTIYNALSGFAIEDFPLEGEGVRKISID